MNIETFLSPLFGIALTIAVYFLSLWMYSKYKFILLNPVLISTVSIIVLLKVFHVEFEFYNKGGKVLGFFLGPAIVALGVFMYEKFEEVKNQVMPFLLAVATGGIISILSVILVLSLFDVSETLVLSLIPKSATSPIAIEIIKIIGGYEEIAAGIVIAVGILGNAFGPAFLRLFGIRDQASIGAALGTACHGIGTARAIEESKTAGIYSGLAMCVNGVFTAVTAPWIVAWVL